MAQNVNSFDPSEKRVSLVYNSDISGFQALDFSKLDEIETSVKDSFPVYNSLEMKYDEINNNTGVVYKYNGTVKRILIMGYDDYDNLTGVQKIDY